MSDFMVHLPFFVFGMFFFGLGCSMVLFHAKMKGYGYKVSMAMFGIMAATGMVMSCAATLFALGWIAA